MDNTIHVACNIDGNYVTHCAVTLVSLFYNNKQSTFTVHVIADDLTELQQSVLRKMCADYGNQIFFYPPKRELLEGFCVKKFSNRISIATYYRCILAEILPETINRVLYLDCDIVIVGDVRPFWMTPMEGIGVAAVEDSNSDEAQRYEILHYPMEKGYFNAGVLLVNLAYWRSHSIGTLCRESYHAHPERFLYNDQDLLNTVLHDSKVLVDLKWNAQDAFFRNPCRMTDEKRNKYACVVKNPVILHYTNRKPWNYDSQHPLRHEYQTYLDLTPWAGQYPWKSIKNRVKRFFRLLPFYVGLRKPKYINLCDGH